MHKELLATSANGLPVFYDPMGSHAATHFADTPQLKGLVQEILAGTVLDGPQMIFETDLGRIIGTTDLVVNEEGDVIVYAKRKNRSEYTLFNKSKGPQPSSVVTIFVKEIDGVYELITAWVGGVAPPFPGDVN
ncbi:hypothetical protein JNJ66_07400 [Candidatus Saccharibacteria bacterium]|nr:hypothetical protein [Candidatus Saccharibacteria bacterium]